MPVPAFGLSITLGGKTDFLYESYRNFKETGPSSGAMLCGRPLDPRGQGGRCPRQGYGRANRRSTVLRDRRDEAGDRGRSASVARLAGENSRSALSVAKEMVLPDDGQCQ